jgi:hypothetical protein
MENLNKYLKALANSNTSVYSKALVEERELNSLFMFLSRKSPRSQGEDNIEKYLNVYGDEKLKLIKKHKEVIARIVDTMYLAKEKTITKQENVELPMVIKRGQRERLKSSDKKKAEKEIEKVYGAIQSVERDVSKAQSASRSSSKEKRSSKIRPLFEKGDDN